MANRPRLPPQIHQVRVVPYDPDWPAGFAKAAAELAAAADVLDIHHIGSTAVPGIHAKPIIDLLPVVADMAVFDTQSGVWALLGYEALGELGIPGRRYFRRFNAAGARTHHIHVFQQGSPHVERHLAFRDFLRVHPEIAENYSELKQRLAAAHANDWGAYCAGKDAFVLEVEKQAMEWRPV